MKAILQQHGLSIVAVEPQDVRVDATGFVDFSPQSLHLFLLFARRAVPAANSHVPASSNHKPANK